MKIERRTFDDNKTAKITIFSSIDEMTTYFNTTDYTELFKNRSGGLGSQKSGKKYWYGTGSFNEAAELLRTGWTDKAKELEGRLSQKLNKEPTQVLRQKSVYDVVGGNCSVPRYLQGVPTSMVRQVRTPVKQKTITINYNISFNSDVSAEEITENAIDCLAHVKQLEDAGTRVNLNCVWITEENKKYLSWVVPVKRTSERFSLAKAAFCLCHPSMLRRIAFGCLERELEADESFVWGYGRSVRNLKELNKIFPGTEFFN